VEPLRLANDEIAQKVTETCLFVFRELENTLTLVEIDGQNEKSKRFRNAVANVLGALVDVMGPLYAAHPQIKPESWKDIEL